MKRLYFILQLMVAGIVTAPAQQTASEQGKKFTRDFDVRNCTFETTGRNHFFILDPGYQLVLKGVQGKDTSILTITVLKEVREVRFTQTRVVEERETKNGKLTEVSRNYFSFCRESGTVFYFGEEVDNYKNGKIMNHAGSWLAEADFLPGVEMPGLLLLGARYYQEVASGVAMDRAEVISLSETITTPAGTFPECLKTEETSALNPNENEYKIYAPGIGLVKDEEMVLVSYGYIK